MPEPRGPGPSADRALAAGLGNSAANSGAGFSRRAGFGGHQGQVGHRGGQVQLEPGFGTAEVAGLADSQLDQPRQAARHGSPTRPATRRCRYSAKASLCCRARACCNSASCGCGCTGSSRCTAGFLRVCTVRPAGFTARTGAAAGIPRRALHQTGSLSAGESGRWRRSESRRAGFSG